MASLRQPEPPPSLCVGAEASASSIGLFTYGTLLFADVLQILLDRVPSRRAASAPGWRAALLRDRPYPALVPADDVAEGHLLTGLSRKERLILRAYENGTIYQLTTIPLADGEIAEAYTCVDERAVREENWDKAFFAGYQLAAFLIECETWRASFDSSPLNAEAP